MGAAKVNFRPAIGWRLVGWAMIAFGLIFGAAGAAYLGQDAAGGALMIGFGAVLVISMLGLATAVVTADDSGLTYRNIWPRQVAIDDIASIEVRERPGFAYGRTGIVVTRRSRKPLRLTALDRPNNPPNQARAHAQAEQIARAVGIAPTTHSPRSSAL